MIKFFGRGDILKGATAFDAAEKYRSMEFYDNKDYRSATDIERPIINLYENQQEIYKFLEAFADFKLTNTGIFPGSLGQGFQLTQDDVMTVDVDGTTKYYVRLPPGIAGINFSDNAADYQSNYAFVNRPSILTAERFLEKALGLNTFNASEYVEIRYDYNFDGYKAKIHRVAQTEYFGCVDEIEFQDPSIFTCPTGLNLILDIYHSANNGAPLNAAIGKNLERVPLEPLVEFFDLNVDLYIALLMNGEVSVSNNVGLKFVFAKFNHNGTTTVIDNSVAKLISDREELNISGDDIDSFWLNTPGGVEFNTTKGVVFNIGSGKTLNVAQDGSFVIGDATGNRIFMAADGNVTVTTPKMTVTGNFEAQGTSVITNATQVEIGDNVLVLNKDQTGTPLAGLISGLEVERGDLTNYRIIFNEATQALEVGIVGTMQQVLTRDDDVAVPIPQGTLFKWDATNKKATRTAVKIDAEDKVFATGFFTEADKTGFDYKANGEIALLIDGVEEAVINDHGISKAVDAEKLNGELPEFYASQTDLINAFIKDYIAGEAINEGQLCCVKADGKVFVADKRYEDAVEVIGFAKSNAAALNDPIRVQIDNVYLGPTDRFTVGSPIFLGDAGAVIFDDSTVNPGEYRVYIGTAVSIRDVSLAIGEAIFAESVDYSKSGIYSSLGKNFIGNSTFEYDIISYGRYNDGAVAAPIDGKDGVSTLTIAQNKDSPLAEVADLQLTALSNSMGQGIAYDFTISKAYLIDSMYIKFRYLTSAAFATGDISVYVYDVTNGAMIQLSLNDVQASTTPNAFFATFNPVSTSTNYRLIWHVKTNNAFSINLDEIQVTPNVSISTQITEYVTGENITLGNAVCIKADGKLYKASKDDINSVEVVGFAKYNYATGLRATVVNAGMFTNPGWALTVGSPVYLSNAGALLQDTSTIATGEFRAYLGIALSATSISITIQEPIQINNAAQTQNRLDSIVESVSGFAQLGTGNTLIEFNSPIIADNLGRAPVGYAGLTYYAPGTATHTTNYKFVNKGITLFSKYNKAYAKYAYALQDAGTIKFRFKIGNHLPVSGETRYLLHAASTYGLSVLMTYNSLQVMFATDASNYIQLTTPLNIIATLTSWHDIAISWNKSGNSLTVYVDGVSQGTTATGTGISTASIAGTINKFVINAYENLLGSILSNGSFYIQDFLINDTSDTTVTLKANYDGTVASVPYNNTEVFSGNGAKFSLTRRGVVSGTSGYFNEMFVGGEKYKKPTQKNRIMNGEFNILQRALGATTVPAANNGTYYCDRWKAATGTGSSVTMTQRALTVSALGDDESISNYMELNLVAPGDATAGKVTFSQPIENTRLIAGKMMTLSFYASATGTPNISVGIVSNGLTTPIISTFTPAIALTATWTKYQATVHVPSLSSNTINADDNFELVFYISSGTALVTSNATGIGQNTAGNIINITKVQFEEGVIATGFEKRTYGEELALCRRYFTGFGVGVNTNRRIASGTASATITALMNVQFPVTMRKIPALYLITGAAGYQVTDGVTATVLTALAITANTGSVDQIGLTATVASGLTQFRPYFLETLNGATLPIGFDAEL